MGADDADLAVAVRPGHDEAPARAERDVVLGDLVALREVGIPVVLAVEERAVDLAAEREAECATVHSTARGFGTGSAPGCARQTGGARVLVLAPDVLAAAEHLRPRLQLDVDLEADDRFPAVLIAALDLSKGAARPPSRRGGRGEGGAGGRPPRGGGGGAGGGDGGGGGGEGGGGGGGGALRDVVEAERALERVAGAEEQVLGELRADQLQADRQPVREAARDREAGQAGHVRRGS